MDKHGLTGPSGIGQLAQQNKAQLTELIQATLNNNNPAITRGELQLLLLQMIGLISEGSEGTIEVSAPISGDGSVGDPVTVTSGGITASYLATNSVSTVKIVAEAVTGPKIAKMGATTNLEVIGFNVSTQQWSKKGLVAGANVTLTETDDTITVAASGGGGGSSFSYRDAGNGCRVFADGNVTYTKAVGTGTITIPASVSMTKFEIVGAAGDLSSGEITVTIVDGNTGGTYNTSDANTRHPQISIQNRNVVLPTDPYLQRPDDSDDSINIFHERFAVNTQSKFKITGLSGDFGIIGVY